MRKILVALVFTFFAGTLAFAGDDIDEKHVPVIVKNKLKELHPKAQFVDWEYKYKKGYYEAEFKIDGLKSETKISADGVVIEDETTLYVDQLPKKAKEYIDQQYSNPVVTTLKRVTELGNIKYVAKIRYSTGKGNRHYTLVFDKDGRVIKG